MKTNYMRVEGSPNLKRDPYSKAIVNVDDDGYHTYIAQREANERKRQEQQDMRKEIDNLKTDVSEIKNMLLKLLEKN